MSAIDLPILAGIFDDEILALHALEKLQRAGFHDEQLGMVMRNGRLLPVSIFDTLLSIGIPEEEASIYQSELDAGHVLLLVKHRGRILEAFRCMFEITVTGMSATPQNQSQERIEAAYDSSTNTLFEQTSSRQEEAATADDTLCVWKLLKNAGLEHLL